MEISEYTNKSIGDIFLLLKSSGDGLSGKEVTKRQKDFGLNEAKENNVAIFRIFLKQFKSPFFYLLFGAVILSFFIGDKIDSITLFLFILINVVIGFFQEFKAEKSVFLLKKFVQQKVRVKRNGKQDFIEKKYLVPGDIVLLKSGDIVSADLRIIRSYNLLVNESVITGESLPVQKYSSVLPNTNVDIFEAKNMLFAGTSVLSGKAEAIVLATGDNTYLGSIAKIVSKEDKQSSYEKNIFYFSRLVLKIVSTTIILVFVTNIAIKGLSVFVEILLFSVALIISILPEALPAVVTFALSKGSLKMAKQQVVVKRLSSIEDLGNIDILCADKTGTLTQNKLSLEKIVTSDKEKCFLYGILSSGKIENFSGNEKEILDPFDAAIFDRASGEIFRQAQKYNIISELPFDPFRMMSSVLAENKGGKIIIVKGSPESVLNRCVKFNGRFTKSEIKEDVKREGESGKRVLALAYKKINPVGKRSIRLFEDKTIHMIKESDEKGLTFLGYFAFEDPLKPTAEEAIKLSKKLGIDIKIITGDSKEVAGHVARKTGLIQASKKILSGEDLEKMTYEEFEDACENESVFARVSPSMKHKIIRTLEKNHDVGFIGEGVNDAPALKAANVGIAVAEASDIAREASDVVLLKKDLRVIINGIKDGRMIFSNINKYIKCALASNFGNFYSIAVISIFINFLPMLPVQILLGNLFSDFPLISIATDSVDAEELKRPKMYQLHMVLPLIISLALVSTLFDFIFFSIFYKQSPGVIQTLWFIESILTEILLIFIIRTKHVFYKAKRPGFWLSTLAIIDGVFIIALPFLPIGKTWFHFVTPPLTSLFILGFLIAGYFIISELVKLAYFKKWGPDYPRPLK